MKKKIFKNIFLVTISIFINFLSVQNSHSALISEYFPEEVGYYWIYKNIKPPYNTTKITILEKTMINGYNAFKCETSFSDRKDKIIGYDLIIDDKKIGYLEKEWRTVLEFPAEIKYSKVINLPDSKAFLTEIIGEEEIEISLGKFKCYKIKQALFTIKEGVAFSGTFWVTKGIGIIKIEDEFGTRKEICELKEYKVQK